MMDLFIAICEDRHIDPIIRVFSSLAQAISYCVDFMEERQQYDWERDEDVDKWIFYHLVEDCGYSVHVEQSSLNNEEN